MFNINLLMPGFEPWTTGSEATTLPPKAQPLPIHLFICTYTIGCLAFHRESCKGILYYSSIPL